MAHTASLLHWQLGLLDELLWADVDTPLVHLLLCPRGVLAEIRYASADIRCEDVLFYLRLLSIDSNVRCPDSYFEEAHRVSLRRELAIGKRLTSFGG